MLVFGLCLLLWTGDGLEKPVPFILYGDALSSISASNGKEKPTTDTTKTKAKNDISKAEKNTQKRFQKIDKAVEDPATAEKVDKKVDRGLKMLERDLGKLVRDVEAEIDGSSKTKKKKKN
jgi:hypothetical protein